LSPISRCGQLVEEASGQNSFHKLALGMRSALDRYGERKTVASGDSDDLGALAAPRGTDREAPFLALAKVASTNASSRLSLPRSCRCLASSRSASTNLPSRTHAETGDGRSGTADTFPASRPLRSGAEHPQHPVQHRPRVNATDGPGYPRAALDARPAPTTPTVRLSLPNGLPYQSAETP
jgi:hypothetical protein